MEYTVNKLAELSGVSTRTLRYYDEIGLLSPARIADNKYRIYGQKEIDRLQQILFYRELSVPLEKISQILDDDNSDKIAAMEQHLLLLMDRKKQIETLIANVTKTIRAIKGEDIMSDKEKFEGFKQHLISENEEKYGKEIREKYGNEIVDGANDKIEKMCPEQWQKAQKLSLKINENLKSAFETGDPSGETAQKVCELHREWLCMFWPDGTYSKEGHRALAESYVADERFTDYYDRIAAGCTKFLRDAIIVFCK